MMQFDTQWISNEVSLTGYNDSQLEKRYLEYPVVDSLDIFDRKNGDMVKVLCLA